MKINSGKKCGTDQRCGEHTELRWHLPFAPDEDRVGFAVEFVAECAHTQVGHGADHVVETHEVRAPNEAEDNGAEESANETLNRLLGRQLDQGRTANCDTPHVCEDVVADDE